MIKIFKELNEKMTSVVFKYVRVRILRRVSYANRRLFDILNYPIHSLLVSDLHRVEMLFVWTY